MYLDDFECTWDYVTVILKDGNHIKEYTMERPRQMWDSVIAQYVQYCPSDANKAFMNSIGDDIEVVYDTDDGFTRAVYTRPDGYQVAIIKFKTEE